MESFTESAKFSSGHFGRRRPACGSAFLIGHPWHLLPVGMHCQEVRGEAAQPKSQNLWE
jgi:hypothetical protein